MTQDPTAAGVLGGAATPQGWRAGAVRPPTEPRLLREIENLGLRNAAFRDHREALAALGSQAVYAAPCRVRGSEDCDVALIRFSGAIESAFGFTREVMFFYSPYRDLQYRTFAAARASMRHLPREVTPDLIFFTSPDGRSKAKLDDWSRSHFLAVPLSEALAEPVALVELLRDYVFARDLYYETTPVSGDRFFGRKPLLQSLRNDLRDRRVAGVFGLRKAGKTSVLSELRTTMSSDGTIFLLRDLESLPSPPDDPIPDLLADLKLNMVHELRQRGLAAHPLVQLQSTPSIAAFRRALQETLAELNGQVEVFLALDEIEYLVPADRIDVREGNMPSIAQFLGALRSLVQENSNFTFLLSGLTSALIECGRLYGRPNPLFSWAKTYFISPFTRSEADDLAQSVGQRMGVRLEQGALEALYEATGGHAFLYRHLASAVVCELPMNVMYRSMTRADVLRALQSWRRDVAGNIDEMVNHLRRYYPDEAFLLDTLSKARDEFSLYAHELPAEIGHLVKLGLIEEGDDGFSLTPVLQL